MEVNFLPNIKSAKKRVLIAEKKALRNQMIKSAIKTAIKHFDVAVISGDMEASKASFCYAVKKLDQASSKGIIHKNTAARKKAQLAIKLNASA